MQAERGYLIPAVNTDTVDYVACARALSLSIKQWHPTALTCLLTDTVIEDSAFDYVVPLPFGDQARDSEWKLSNDWQCFRATPFRQTIKLEADMLAVSPVDHWWTLFEHRDVVISQGCRTYHDTPATSRAYRKLFDNNDLPDVYNAITYWRRSNQAKAFFDMVQSIFENWPQWRTLLKFPDDNPTTDVVYAMAAQVLGVENVTLPPGHGPSIVHMKSGIQAVHGPDWTQELVWEHTDPGLRIQTVAQFGFFHYHNKEWILHG